MKIRNLIDLLDEAEYVKSELAEITDSEVSEITCGVSKAVMEKSIKVLDGLIKFVEECEI